jgi:hypothetical protein
MVRHQLSRKLDRKPVDRLDAAGDHPTASNMLQPNASDSFEAPSPEGADYRAPAIDLRQACGQIIQTQERFTCQRALRLSGCLRIGFCVAHVAHSHNLATEIASQRGLARLAHNNFTLRTLPFLMTKMR